MASRLKLHEELITLLGSENVYFQPPTRMSYPCIKYSKKQPSLSKANNKIYRNTNRYEITVIDYNPESEIPNKILEHFPMCSIDNSYVSDNLNHTILTLYY